MILAYVRDSGRPHTPSSIASKLPIPRERAKKAMQRLAKKGELVRTGHGFTARAGVGTKCCITTPL
jgi:DNA-binding IclR family transcriptional regulator